jgi:hypothetical protein
MARLEKEDIGLKKEQVDIHELIQDAVKPMLLTPSNYFAQFTS